MTDTKSLQHVAGGADQPKINGRSHELLDVAKKDEGLEAVAVGRRNNRPCRAPSGDATPSNARARLMAPR